MSVMGCKYIFIDHLSIIVSDQSGDERKQLDEISTKLKMLTMELDICVHCIIHTNRDGQARGSAGPEKVANIHLALHRDKDDPDPWRRNVTKLVIVKNRFCGRTGPACYLFYDEGTGRLIELDETAVGKYEMGLSINDTDLPF
jgi:twinkle protein